MKYKKLWTLGKELYFIIWQIRKVYREEELWSVLKNDWELFSIMGQTTTSTYFIFGTWIPHLFTLIKVSSDRLNYRYNLDL